MLRRISNTKFVIALTLVLAIGCSAPKKQRSRAPKYLSPAALSFCQFAETWKAYDAGYRLDDLNNQYQGSFDPVTWEGRVTDVSTTGIFFTMVPLAGPKVECFVFASKTGVIPPDTVVGVRSTIHGFVRTVGVLGAIVEVKEPENPSQQTSHSTL